jgi:putative two-component system response regulator
MAGKAILKDDYNVFPIPSGYKLLEILEKVRPDLILLDIEMPGMNGYETIKKLKAEQKTAGIPVIFLTAGSDTGGEHEGLSLGAVDYIYKPFSPAPFLERIRDQLLAPEDYDDNARQAARKQTLPAAEP